MLDKCRLRNSVRRIWRAEWHPQRCRLNVSFDELAPGFVARPEFVAGRLQSIKSRSRELLLHQNIIRVICRNREERNTVIRQRPDEREQHSGLRERKRAVELKTNPART